MVLGVRPEDVAISSGTPSGEQIAAEVYAIEPLGADTLVYGHVKEGARIAARLHGSANAEAGKLSLRYRPEHAHYFDAQTGVRI